MTDWRLSTAIKYTQSSSGDRLVSFISFVSISGLSLGVAVLVIVLSIMNGFEQELKSRVLGVLAHGIITQSDGNMEWQTLRERFAKHSHIEGVAPFLEGNGLVVANHQVQGINYFGIDPNYEDNVSIIGDYFIIGHLDSLKKGEYKAVLGITLAQKLNVSVGDKISLILPKLRMTLAGPIPRSKRFLVSGIYETGSDVDKNQLLINIEDGLKLQGKTNISALRVLTDDLFLAPQVLRELLSAEANPSLFARSWMRRHGNLYEAIQTQKTTMFFLLLMLVTVAAFNIISNLVMVVNEKRSDIAILRTMGASTKEVLCIFILHGLMIGTLGVLIGLVIGIVVTENLMTMYSAIDETFKLGLMDEYFIHYLPSKIILSDLIVIASTSVLICLLVTIYPALIAARTNPIEALQYD